MLSIKNIKIVVYWVPSVVYGSYFQVSFSTNTTQILQACKQMECDNNKY